METPEIPAKPATKESAMCHPSPLPAYKKVIRVGGAGPVAVASQRSGKKIVIKGSGGSRKIVTSGDGQCGAVSTGC